MVGGNGHYKITPTDFFRFSYKYYMVQVGSEGKVWTQSVTVKKYFVKPVLWNSPWATTEK